MFLGTPTSGKNPRQTPDFYVQAAGYHHRLRNVIESIQRRAPTGHYLYTVAALFSLHIAYYNHRENSQADL